MNVGVSGHQSIPPDLVPFITAGIDAVLSECAGPLVGFSALAAGADQLFAHAVLARGGRLRIIVPTADYASTFSNPSDRDTFVALLKRAEIVDHLPYAEASEEAFLQAGKWIVDHCSLLIAVWDGLPARGKGGTADIVADARERDVPVIVVWPEGADR